MTVNETIPEIENSDMKWSPQQIKELREAKRLLKENIVHPILKPWVDELRASGLQPYLQKVNYKNLTWYR